ncbi:MAG: DUF2268 domain-containing putative Zn-dependent protease [Gemmatimonadaceae bacterium]
MRFTRALLLLAFAGCATDAATGPAAPADPAAAQFVTSDLTNFWAAYDAGGRTGNASAFQQLYLENASTGLNDFIARRTLTASSIATMVTAYPRYFAAIRTRNLQLAANSVVIERAREGFRRIKALYPASVFPPVTLLIGRFSTGGTTSENGMLIGTEFYSAGSDTPLDELGVFQHDNVMAEDSLPIIIAHEHVHILQSRARGVFAHGIKTLLDQALIEGSADFVGSLASGGNINARLWAYALPREGALWAEFSAQMHGTDVSRWLYNQLSTSTDRPGDLGYFIGYRIAESFYNRATDKTAALRDIIEMANSDEFLARSGYAPSP